MANKIKVLSGWWTKKVKSNPYWILLLAVISIKRVVEIIIDSINMFHSLHILKLPIFTWEFAANVLQIATVYIVFRLYKKFVSAVEQINKIDEQRAKEINQSFEFVTTNLNDSHRLLYKMIRYVDLRFEYKDLNNDEFIEKLHDNNFSKEDLELIQVSKEFLEHNKNKLYPKALIEKYKAFKDELDKHRKENEDDVKS